MKAFIIGLKFMMYRMVLGLRLKTISEWFSKSVPFRGLTVSSINL